ncbi:hypothetical protein ACFFJ7_17540 [Pseudochelatococcus lubricantis]|uniref:AtuA-related protein n=1 Tax=Pseudochelatococcus lubricantis TaxID=1538102 RepID=UPI0035EF3DF2
MPEVELHLLAHARAGDKGNRANISLICFDPADYELLRDQVTEKAVSELFSMRHPVSVRRYELPNIAAFNFVLDGVLEGGVNSSLGLDGHGKALSFLLLQMKIEGDPYST